MRRQTRYPDRSVTATRAAAPHLGQPHLGQPHLGQSRHAPLPRAAATLLAALLLAACSTGVDEDPLRADGSGALSTDAGGADGAGASDGIQTIDELCWWEDCSATTWCVAGTPTACTPVACDVPTPAKDATAWQISQLTFPEETVGCDLDDDGVSDNALGVLKKVVTSLDKDAATAIANGRYTQLLRPVLDAKGVLVAVEGLTGALDPTALAAGCVAAGADTLKRCPVRLRKESYRLDEPGVCTLKARCGAKSITRAGTSAVQVSCAAPVPQPVIASPQVTLPGYQVSMIGTLPLQDGQRQLGLHTQTAKLRVCGLLKWSDANKRLDLVPAAVLKKLGTDVTSAKKLLSGVVQPDIDTDGDGEADSVSFAVDVELREVKIVGVAQ